MKVLAALIFLVSLPTAFAQKNLTGPGVKDEPPTSGVEVQDRKLGRGASTLPTKDAAQPSKRIVPQVDEREYQGAAGKQAQEDIKNGRMEISKEEQKKKRERSIKQKRCEDPGIFTP